MHVFKSFMSATVLLILCYTPYAYAIWYQIEVIAFQHGDADDHAEEFTSDVGEPLWSKGTYLLDEEEAAARRQELLARAHAQEMNDLKAAADAQTAETPPKTQENVESKPPEGFVSVESLLEENAPKPAPQPTASPAQSKPVSHKSLNEVPFVDLPPSAFTMNRVESYLEDNRDYRILTHVAWRQPALTGNHAEWVRIYGGDVVASGSNLRYDQPNKIWEFEALLSLSQSKFLHIDADAVLRESGRNYRDSDYQSANDLGLVVNDEGERYRNPKITTYRLSQSQRIKSGQLYYFDHPLIGMIVKITPYDV